MESSASEKTTVLYVDDIKANLMLFEASFDGEYNILLAESGVEALKVLEESEVHVIVSDQNMPGMTGNELLEKVTLDYPDVMRFMITAYTDYETVVEAINKGHLYGFFNKPYNIEDVKLSIDKSMEVRQLRINNREMIEKLEKANEALLGIDRSKTNFLSTVTDEIRNPINKIMTAVHMIKDKIDSKELTELLNLLDTSVSRLENFSESAQSMVRLNDANFKLKDESVSLKEVLEVCVIEKGNVLNEKQLKMNLSFGEDLRKISGEFDLVLNSCCSLVELIVEHASDGQEIYCFAENKGSGIMLKIGSEGVKIPDIDREALFAIFNPDEFGKTVDAKVEVMLAKEIVHAHKGKIVFRGSNDSAEFNVFFPAS